MADEKRARKHSKTNGFLHVLLVYILPFIIVNAIIFYIVTAQPKFEVTLNDSPDYTSAEAIVKIKSIFPRKEFVIKLNEEPLEYEEGEDSTYRAVITQNGTLEVSLTNLNGMNKTEYESINCIDDAPPIITEDDSATGYMSIYVEDLQSGVDFNSIYAVDNNGKTLHPSLSDEGEGLVVFNFDAESLEVHVFDKVGHESIATFTTTYVPAEGTDGEADAI